MQQRPRGDMSRLAMVVRGAARRYRLPALPARLQDAVRAGPETTIAFALEVLRRQQAGADSRASFVDALAQLVARARDTDPVFQAQLLRAAMPEVEAYLQLQQQAPADRRAVRALPDAVAHPGKLRAMAAGAERERLSQVHGLATREEWTALAAAVQGEARLAAIASSPALARLVQLQAGQGSRSVRQYLALVARGGPLPGSDAAFVQGRAASDTGDAAERSAMQAFRSLASAGERVVRGLRMPAGFPGARHSAKDEFDVAVLRGDEVVLLAEVKASPAAASTDLPKLLRGLQRLAQAQDGTGYTFKCEGGEVVLAGASLQALAPRGGALPEQVVYCSTAPAETQPSPLGAAARAMLLAESVAFAGQSEGLGAMWDALQQPRMRAVVEQYETARLAREAMLHPDDLIAASG